MQTIKVYKDGESFCARWGEPFPEHLGAGFGPSPLAAVVALVEDLEGKVAKVEELDYEEETDIFGNWLVYEIKAALGQLRSQAELIETMAKDVARKCDEPDKRVFNGLGEIQNPFLDVYSARVSVLIDIQRTYNNVKKTGKTDPWLGANLPVKTAKVRPKRKPRNRSPSGMEII